MREARPDDDVVELRVPCLRWSRDLSSAVVATPARAPVAARGVRIAVRSRVADHVRAVDAGRRAPRRPTAAEEPALGIEHDHVET